MLKMSRGMQANQKLGVQLKRHNALCRWVLAALLVLVPTLVQADLSQGTSIAALPELDSRYQELSDEAFHALIKGKPSSGVEMTPEALAEMLLSGQPTIDKILLIRANIQVVLKHINGPYTKDILNFLYDNNDTATIKALTDHLKQRGTPSTIMTNYFLLAKYYNSRSNWKGVRAALSGLDLKELAELDQHYYHLLMGYALQQIKEHRKAYKYYQQIPKTSPYYAHAKLNEGTAYLRQGWWTEAHIEFNRAIQSLVGPADQQFRDRLLVVLGFSQLHNEFYRDARETLRKVTLNSAYTNKALMGLGLAAAYQEDFAGSINAFRILSTKPSQDISVDEAVLLLAKAYEETKDTASASLAYQHALAYYTEKTLLLNSLVTELDRSQSSQVASVIQSFNERSPALFGKQEFVPPFFIANYHLLISIQNQPLSGAIKARVDSLQIRYQNQLKAMVRENLELRLAIINSYLSQAKFGVAKLYDKP